MSAFAAAAHADPVDDYVNAEMARRHVPGLALAVVRNGEVVKLAGYGQADAELGVAATPQTVFQIQSVTKTMTAAAILLLVEEGKLSLTDPVSRHLEGTPDAWKGVTLRHLLSHTSGIKDFINDPTASLRIDVTEQDVLAATAPRPLNFEPSARYEYSNTGYHLLAMVIRKVTGKSYGDFLAERFFGPLGMTHTRVLSLSDVIPHRASGYAWGGGALRRGDYIAESILSYGGGGVISTAADMAVWAQALAAGRVLPEPVLERAWTPETLSDGSKSAYGLGWGVMDVNGHRVVGHSGAHMTGFTSNFSHFPEDGLTVVVLTNAGHANPRRIGRRVAGLIAPELAPAEPAPIEDKEPAVTARVRDILLGLHKGELTASLFTPGLAGLIEKELPDWKRAGAERGELVSLDLLDRTEAGGAPTYQYRATYPTDKLSITMTTNPEGLITGWRWEEE
jgi:D-alanyl-D-alanine carboxypeptidase